MKIEIPEKVRIVITVVDRIGVPTVLCLIFAYIYFTQLQKVRDDIKEFRVDVRSIGETSKSSHDEILREVRRLGYRTR